MKKLNTLIGTALIIYFALNPLDNFVINFFNYLLSSIKF
ncbi:hypothetical protein HMPREF9629_00710 [Peptoanaerobacter stomatis]|jgi:hypothetical protein|uniref:Uncharacterized protein n=1 Tax=Peptoanaerobacter stomatis TaxID=796937 RepID=G9X2V3_9FIRM|nr:hypothetical protein HMPREF9629_00710 [Peptoanaerobacter stomatis]